MNTNKKTVKTDSKSCMQGAKLKFYWINVNKYYLYYNQYITILWAYNTNWLAEKRLLNNGIYNQIS